ncbi:MAG: nodulation protein NfeD [SAR202 cluster bacterium]|nr:nodulation protein NfeD [SAR202 cluster bacterium]
MPIDSQPWRALGIERAPLSRRSDSSLSAASEISQGAAVAAARRESPPGGVTAGPTGPVRRPLDSSPRRRPSRACVLRRRLLCGPECRTVMATGTLVAPYQMAKVRFGALGMRWLANPRRRRADPGRLSAALRVLAVLSVLWGLIATGFAGAQTPGPGPVYRIEIQGVIDLGVAPYLRRVLREAEATDASAVVLDINTPGGRLDAALDMKNALLETDIPTVAFVNREAYSAGALIAISTDRIYMAPGAVLGAATPVTGQGETADEKTVSAVRSAFRSVAEATGRNPDAAAAMVDPRVEVEGLDGPDTLLTLTVSEALAWDYAEAELATFADVLEAEGLAGQELVDTSPGFAEAVVRFVTNPVVASILIAVGFLGLLIEIQTPGFGVGGIVGILSLALFFWGHLLAGLAGWEGIALVGAGLALIAVEVFVIPGFGMAGILGVAAFLAGIYVSLIGTLPSTDDFLQAALMVTAALLAIVVGALLSLRFLPRRSMGGLVLNDRLLRWSTGTPATARPDAPVYGTQNVPGSLVGAVGRAVNDLHPAGTAVINGQRVDVVAEEGYVAAGSAVEVILDEGYRRVVRGLTPGVTPQTTTKPME